MSVTCKMIIIDYGLGNLRSVANALDFVGCENAISGSPQEIAAADGLILPGVGAFADGMRNLRERGLVPVLEKEVLEHGKPILGICLGMQLLARDGDENGFSKGLGWIPASVKKLEPLGGLKVPHIGWNDVSPKTGSRLFADVEKPVFYFVHSYHVACDDADAVVATCDYGQKFAAAIETGNIFAAQFHPEKSQAAGLRLLRNFAATCSEKKK